MTIAKASHTAKSLNSASYASSSASAQEYSKESFIPALDVSSTAAGSQLSENDTGLIEFAPLTTEVTLGQIRESAKQTTFPSAKGKRAFGFANRMAQATSVDNLYQIAVSELKKGLQCDRAIIYRFHSEQEGQVIAEALTTGYTPTLERSLNVLAFGATHADDYLSQPAVALSNADKDSVSPYQSQLLQQFQVKASLSLPVFLSDHLWGLLVVQQCDSSRQWKDRETAMLYQLGTELTLRLQAYELHQYSDKELTRSRTLTRITQNIHQASHLQQAFGDTTRHLRTFLGAERVMIFQLTKTHSSQGDRSHAFTPGKVIAEQVAAHIPTIQPPLLEDSRFNAPFSKHNASVQSVEDIYTDASLSQEQVDSLSSFQVRASLSAPLFKGNQLWGFLCAHQCTEPRRWKKVESTFVERVAAQLSLALKQANYLKQVQEKTEQLEASIAKEQFITKVTEKLRTADDLPKTLRTMVRDIRRMLKADRVGLFQFDPEKNYTVGEYVVEDVAVGTASMLTNKLQDHCFADEQAENYRKGRYWVVDDVSSLELPECLVEILEQMQVKASIVVPLLKGDILWGLFSIHQCQQPRKWQDSDVQFAHRIGAQLNLALQQAEYLAQVQEKTQKLEASVEKEQLITRITERLRTSNDLSKTLRTTVRDIRRMMQADRVGLFQFDPEKNYTVGEYVVEDVAAGTISMLETKLQDHCFADEQAENYRKGRYWVVDDVSSLELPECLVEILEQMQVKASIVVPLLKGDILWGLFSIHQCQQPREWQDSDVQFAHRIGAQLNLALQQAEYLAQVQEKTQKLKETAAREKASKEKLQAQVIQLLKAVAPALEGDLTVRVPVTDTEVGTIASAYNNTLQSLQKIVLQVQAAADEVSETSKRSETSVVAVTQQAHKQAETIRTALSRVQTMVQSTEAVAEGAQQIEAAAQQANQVVQRGDSAMNLTVDGIMAIRSTVAETNKHIKRLSESSQKVSKIVSLISHFTTQTQLLALNASIEATRAGEYGRGFAVVADEVRSLARQSAAAATEIEQFVQEIQSGTAEVSTAMETGIAQVAEGTALVTDARQNLTAIVEATGQISQLIADITQTTHSQVEEFKAVTQTMTAATDIANQTSESSSALSGSIQQVLTTAEALQVSAAQFKSQ